MLLSKTGLICGVFLCLLIIMFQTKAAALVSDLDSVIIDLSTGNGKQQRKAALNLPKLLHDIPIHKWQVVKFRSKIKKAIFVLSGHLSSEDKVLRRIAIESLGTIYEAFNVWNQSIKTERKYRLNHQHIEKCSPAIIQMIGDILVEEKDHILRYEAAYALFKMSPLAENSIPYLKAGLASSEADIRALCLRAFYKMGLKAQVTEKILKKLILGDSEWEVRFRATECLASISKMDKRKAAVVLPIFIGALSKGNINLGTVKNDALYALGKMGSFAAPSVSHIVKVLVSEDETLIKEMACFALGEIGNKAEEAIPYLLSELKREDCKITVRARDALKKIMGKGYGKKIAAGISEKAGNIEIKRKAKRAKDAKSKWHAQNEFGIVFQALVDSDNRMEICCIKVDGSGFMELSKSPTYDGFPSCSPKGNKIAFVSSRENERDIFVMNADGSGQKNLTNNPAYDCFPDFSPDGRHIAFHSNRQGNMEICVVDTLTSNVVRLTEKPAVDGFPSWSPDGKKIAFTSRRDGYCDIYVMNSDGSNQQRITEDSFDEGKPGWAPDGSKIIFPSMRDGKKDIYIINADGTGEGQLTKNGSGGEFPSFSPDGQKIVFVRGGRLFVMNAKGTEAKEITNKQFKSAYYPSWALIREEEEKKVEKAR